MRILLVTTRFPMPAWRGQQVRTVEWMEALRDHSLALVCPEGDGAQELEGIDLHTYGSPAHSRMWAALRHSGIGSLPVQEGLYASGAARRAVKRAVAEFSPELVMIQMARCAWAAEIVESQAPGIPILFDAIDAMGLHFGKMAERVHTLFRPLVRAEASRCHRREVALASRAAMTVAVADRDLQNLEVPPGRGMAVPVAGRKSALPLAPAAQPTVLLSGNLGYRPTVEGARWFATTVWPAVKSAFPEARWVLAGARPARAIRSLKAEAGVEIHADVPDLGPFLAQSWVAIAPMASGSGVPMKVLEAWAAGIPVLAHPWTAAGLDDSGRDAVLQAEDPREWIEALTDLIGHREKREALAVLGRNAWNRTYHPQKIAEKIREAVEAARGA